MGASLDDIENTIFGALQTLSKSYVWPTPPGFVAPSPGPVSLVDRWVGELPRALDAVTKESIVRTPFLLLAFEREGFYEHGSFTTLAQQYQFEAQSFWTVIVGVSDPRQAKRVAKGDPNAIGAYALASKVIAAVNDLSVPAPNTVIHVQLVGTPNATVTLDGTSHVLVSTSTDIAYWYTPPAQTLTLDGSGRAIVTAPLTNPPGTLGTISPAQPLTWAVTPTGLTATAYCTGMSVEGQNGLLNEHVVSYEGVRPLPGGMVPGKLFTLGVRFSAVRRAEQSGGEGFATPLTNIDGYVQTVPTGSGPGVTTALTPSAIVAGATYSVRVNGSLVSYTAQPGDTFSDFAITMIARLNGLGLFSSVTSTATSVVCTTGSTPVTFSAPMNITVLPVPEASFTGFEVKPNG